MKYLGYLLENIGSCRKITYPLYKPPFFF